MSDTSDPPTLLAHLAPRLARASGEHRSRSAGPHPAHSPAARAALADLLRGSGSNVGPILAVRTQAAGEGGERPDLVAVDERGTERVLIEAKFWAGLTDNQPVAYLKRLPPDEPSALLFVAPEAQRESVWAQLRDRVRAADGLEWQPDQDSPGPRAASVGGERRLLLTSWRTLLGRMASRTSDARETNAELDIRQLRGLADRMDQEAFLPLRSEELGPEIPRRLLDFNRLFEDARRAADEKGVARAGPTRGLKRHRPRPTRAHSWCSCVVRDQVRPLGTEACHSALALVL